MAALGLLPAALATGAGTDSQRPFALVIAAAMLSRLIIRIFLMPALYALVARQGDRLRVCLHRARPAAVRNPGLIRNECFM